MISSAYNTISLQTTLASSSPSIDPPPVPHHLLWLAEDGTLGCEHAQVAGDDRRTQFCIDHSVAILLLELMVEKESP